MHVFGYKKLLLLWKKYERHISMVGLVGGFLFDLWLAKRPDSLVDNVLILTYLFSAAAIIVVLNIRTLRRVMDHKYPTEPLFLLFFLQFCFGGLASNFVILYGNSGTLGGNVFFILLLAALALGNEFLQGRYQQLRFNVAVYYFLLLTYCVIAVPTFIFHTIGASVFLASVVVSLFVIGIFLWGLFFVVFRKQEKKQMYEVSAVVLSICVLFIALYFSRVIPPVPLSLKEIGMYHTLERTGAEYVATYERPRWYAFWRDTGATFTLSATAKSAYCFSAVFAPGGLSTPVVHRWEKYNQQVRRWEEQSKYSFPINGGRDGGYRGWSVKALSIGKWRCNVETSQGQLIGRTSFTVVEGTGLALSTTTL